MGEKLSISFQNLDNHQLMKEFFLLFIMSIDLVYCHTIYVFVIAAYVFKFLQIAIPSYHQQLSTHKLVNTYNCLPKDYPNN